MKILLVYNNHAGHGRAKKLLPEVEDYFNQKQIEFDLAITDYPEHGRKIVSETDFSAYDGIVAAGGDGTLFEAINGYYMNPAKKKIPLGVLPVGTGNAFARDLQMDSEHWQKAIDIIAAQKTRAVDVGKFTTHGQTYYFLNIIGIGFVSDVTETASKLKLLGNISYTLGVLYRLIFLQSFKTDITVDGKSFQHDSIFIEISNTTYTANFLMAPNAEIDDGYLDITILNKINRRTLLKAFPKVFTGEHIHLDPVDTIKARKISIQTDKPKILTPDGELIGISPVEIECLPRAVEVFWK